MAKTPKQVTSDEILSSLDQPVPTEKKTPDQPLYRIFEQSRIPISKAVGPAWKKKRAAALVAHTMALEAWEECFRYYSHNQTKDELTPKGHFKRGDATENLVYSNVNTMIPAIMSKYPDISCSTEDAEDDPLCDIMESLLNTLIRRKTSPGINLKPKAKKATMMAELTNFGVMKLDYTLKSDSREAALAELEKLRGQLAKASKDDVATIYGQLQALEMQVETRELNGFKLSNILPHNTIVDPYCEQSDLSDAAWVMEETFLPTEYLNARFTKKGTGEQADDTVLVYKPTHKAQLEGAGEADDGIGIVMEAIRGDAVMPTSFTEEERLGYLYTYMTKVCYVWDKVTGLVFLFQADDWTWPIWVWDDPYHLSRFFPYFIIQFSLSTGGIVTPGAVTYYLDQQDEINDINRQVSRIRKAIFNHFFYNANVVERAEAEKFVAALRGDSDERVVLGAKLEPTQKLEDVLGHIGIPPRDAQPFFDKAQAYNAADRVSATSDALRGTQFKANTTEDAVQAYVDAVRIRVGAKVDCIEDCIADLALAMAELAVQFMDKTDVANLIGVKKAEGWKQMSVADFNGTYSVEIVAGSIEKPTSVFKKKEAIEVVQSIGQFAKGAPKTSLVIMLRVLQKAFTEVVVKKEDFEAIAQETVGTITQQEQAQQQMGGGGMSGQPGGGMSREALASLPPEIKARIVQMRDQGASDQEILQFAQQAMQQTQQPQPQEQANGSSASNPSIQ